MNYSVIFTTMTAHFCQKNRLKCCGSQQILGKLFERYFSYRVQKMQNILQKPTVVFAENYWEMFNVVLPRTNQSFPVSAGKQNFCNTTGFQQCGSGGKIFLVMFMFLVMFYVSSWGDSPLSLPPLRFVQFNIRLLLPLMPWFINFLNAGSIC